MTPLTVLTARRSDPRGPAVIHIVGEVDASNALVFASALSQALAGPLGPITIDCARWTFVDAAGLRVLRHFGDEARLQERLAFLANMSLRMHELLHRVGVDRHFDLGMAGYRSS